MFVNHNNSKSRPTGTYTEVIAKIVQDGVCPFCTEHLKKYHKPDLYEKEFWLVTDNMYPYKPVKNHCLIIHRRHITHIKEMTTWAWLELIQIISDISHNRSLDGGSIILRFGDTKYTGASVAHLHVNIVQSDPDDPSYDKTKGLITRIG